MVRKARKTGKRLARAFVAGLGSLLTISSAHAGYYQPHGTTVNALQGDFARISRDMRKALVTERRSEKASS